MNCKDLNPCSEGWIAYNMVLKSYTISIYIPIFCLSME